MFFIPPPQPCGTNEIIFKKCVKEFILDPHMPKSDFT